MSNIDTRVSVTYDDDDPPPPAYNVSQPSAEVKKKANMSFIPHFDFNNFWNTMCSARNYRYDCIFCHSI